MISGEHDRPGADGPARTSRSTPTPPGLAAAIGAGLRALSDLHRPHPDVTSGALERALRDAVAAYSPRPRASGADPADPLAVAATAVLTACAHLGAGGLVDAYLALLTAHERLPRSHHDDVTGGEHPTGGDVKTAGQHQAGGESTGGDDQEVSRQGSRAADILRRGLDAQTVLGQAGGVLAAHTGLSVEQALAVLHSYAERHRFVLAELAADVVAGRPPPGLTAVLAGEDESEDDTPAQPSG